MSIAKVIRVYFIFTMMVASIAVLSYSDGFENYVLSVLHSTNSSLNTSMITPLSNFDSGLKEYSSINESSSLLNFKIVKDQYGGFAAPGAEGAKVMGFHFKTGSEAVILKDLKLKLDGIESEYIDKAYITDGRNILKVANVSGDYYSFNNINEVIDPNKAQTLNLMVDLSNEVDTGERFRMDIENPEDIVLFTGSDPFSIDEYYPIKGKYLSVAMVK